MELKYIILNDSSPVLFCAHHNHSVMASNRVVVSAGTIRIYPICVDPKDVPTEFEKFNAWVDKLLYQISVTHGSVTLDIKRDPVREKEDQRIIEMFLKPRY